jgi:tetratricopeptide (TPR) repeat protein
MRFRFAPGSLLGVVLGACLVAWTRPKVAWVHKALGEAEEISALPAPEQLDVFSLGYRAALADYLFAITLVRTGHHFKLKKNYLELPNYLDAIVHLEPDFLQVYQLSDSLLTLNTVVPPPGNYRRARTLLERGLERFPSDAELWLSAAQFLLYLAPPWLPPGEDRNEWKAAGAKAMQRACELSPSDPPPGCLSSLRTLAELGQAQAGIDALRRMLALSDDPDFRAELERRLAGLVSVTERARLEQRVLELARRHALDLPLSTRAEYQIAGPSFAANICLGSLEPTCPTSFRAASELGEDSPRPAD